MNKSYETGLGVALAVAGACAQLGCSGDSAEMAANGGSYSGDYGGEETPGSSGLSPGGAQDFGLFRQILEDGAIPAPETLDDLGFFAEHKLDWPAPDCGTDVCMHAMLGVMGNMISGSTCTLLQIGLNSPIDASALPRPPMNLVVAVDVSGSMAGSPLEYAKAGLKEMLPHLVSGDRMSLVTYSDEATVIFESVDVTDTATIGASVDGLQAGGSTNLYAGMFTAFQVADAHRDLAWQNRVLYVSDGVATVGMTDPDRLRSLAEGYAQRGIGITTVGVGTEFDVETMRGVSEVGAGNFYFVEDPAAVKEVFADEVKTFLFPIALDVTLQVSPGSAYDVRGAFGTNHWAPAGGGGTIHFPSLFLAGRTTAEEPIDTGRRGGGGAILIELMPRPDANLADDPNRVGDVQVTWQQPSDGAWITESVQVSTPNPAGDPANERYFSDFTVEKGFVMLNLYAGFRMASQLVVDSDPRSARRTLEALRMNVVAWLADNPDFDVQDDLRYVDMFLANLVPLESQLEPYAPSDPSDPWQDDNGWVGGD